MNNKIKLDTSDPETKAVWDTVLEAKREVASWPAWKRGEPEYTRYLWLFEALLKDRAVTVGELSRTTGVDRRIVDDCVWHLRSEGHVYCAPDSKLCWLYSDEEFALHVNDWWLGYAGRARTLAVEFEVASSTVERWAKGTAIPHPLLRRQVVAFMEMTGS